MNKPDWCPYRTPEELQRAYLKATTLTRLAQKHGVTPMTVHNWLKRRNIPRNPCGGNNNPTGKTGRRKRRKPTTNGEKFSES